MIDVIDPRTKPLCILAERRSWCDFFQKVLTGIRKTWPHTINLGHDVGNQMMWSYH